MSFEQAQSTYDAQVPEDHAHEGVHQDCPWCIHTTHDPRCPWYVPPCQAYRDAYEEQQAYLKEIHAEPNEKTYYEYGLEGEVYEPLLVSPYRPEKEPPAFNTETEQLGVDDYPEW